MASVAQTERETLQDRLAVCGTGTVRGVIVTGVLDQVGKQAGADARRSVLGQLSSARFVDFFSYPASDLLLATYHGASQVGGDRYAAMRGLGAGLAGPFFQGTSAGMLASSLLTGNVRRFCAGLPGAYGMVASFGKRAVSFPRDGQCIFTVVGDPLFPELHAGAVESAARMLGGVATTQVAFAMQDLLTCTYTITW
jgi:uncharacterized protein (TIGR02265 family)